MRPLASAKPFLAQVWSNRSKSASSHLLHPGSQCLKQDTVKFGDSFLAKEKDHYNWSDRFKLAGKNIFTTQELLPDSLLAAGGTALVALIPPHAHALITLPMFLTISRLLRGFKALCNPGEVDKAFQYVAHKKQLAKSKGA